MIVDALVECPQLLSAIGRLFLPSLMAPLLVAQVQTPNFHLHPQARRAAWRSMGGWGTKLSAMSFRMKEALNPRRPSLGAYQWTIS